MCRSASQRIEAGGEESARKLSKIEDEAARSNEVLLKLVREIHESVKVPVQQPKLQALLAMRSRGSSQIANTRNQQLALEPRASEVREDQHYYHIQPDALKTLNQERFIQGCQEFEQFGKTHFIPSSASRPYAARRSAASMDKQLTMAQLVQEIDFIASRQDSADPEEPLNEVDVISAWTRHLGQLVDKWSTNSTKRQIETKSRLAGMHKLLLTLNRLMATRENMNRRVWYTVMAERGIQRIFDKVRASLRSVTIEKEIQTFEEGLEELGFT